MNELKLEINADEIDQTATQSFGNNAIMITPAIGEDYWLFRVKLYKSQSIIGFPKFMCIGIGFAQEKDWNCNLPSSCDTDEIYEHIKHNKKHKAITKGQCIEAIDLIQKMVEKSK